MRLLGGDGFMYPVRESLVTHAANAFTAETEQLGRLDGMVPPASTNQPGSEHRSGFRPFRAIPWNLRRLSERPPSGIPLT
jgi:hypothetical protein